MGCEPLEQLFLFAGNDPVSLTLVGIILIVCGMGGVLFAKFGPQIQRPNTRGSLSLKRHVQGMIFDVLGPTGVRWLGGIICGLMVLAGVILIMVDCSVFGGSSSSPHKVGPGTYSNVTPTPRGEEPSRPERIEETDFLGNQGGNPFRETGPKNSLLIGMRISCDAEDNISSIQPLFLDKGGSYLKGKVYGTETYRKRDTYAKKGYAIGGVQGYSTGVMKGIRVIYMKSNGEKLDTEKRYKSEWLGCKAETGYIEEILSRGTPFVAIGGTYSDVILGLEFYEKACMTLP